LGKKKYLIREFGPEGVELMKLLKRSLDPQNILNPGKVVDI
jgi:FAD/FMN-containing dehydrogenase